MPPRDVGLNVHQRMLLVMHRIGFIPKLGEGPSSQGGYAFARDADIKDRVREECVRAGLAVHVSMDERAIEVIQGQDRDGRPRASILATVAGAVSFVNVDEPSQSVTVGIHGQGLDTQDKALSKATTSAIKYGLLNAFVIPTGNDPDAEGSDVPTHGGARPSGGSRPRPAPQRPPQAASGGHGEPPWPGGADDEPAGDGDPGKCPRHGRPWRSGQYGYYCPARSGQGYCNEKPDPAWTGAHER
jgi:hypothetical protein